MKMKNVRYETDSKKTRMRNAIFSFRFAMFFFLCIVGIPTVCVHGFAYAIDFALQEYIKHPNNFAVGIILFFFYLGDFYFRWRVLIEMRVSYLNDQISWLANWFLLG